MEKTDIGNMAHSDFNKKKSLFFVFKTAAQKNF